MWNGNRREYLSAAALPSAMPNNSFRPVSGLASGLAGRVDRLPTSKRSGTMIRLHSLTVAGAAPGLRLVQQRAPASRFILRVDTQRIPEAAGREAKALFSGCQGKKPGLNRPVSGRLAAIASGRYCC